MESEAERDPEARLQDFQEEDERCVYRSENTENCSSCAWNKYNWLLLVRSGSEETVDTVVAVSSAKKQENREAENR